MGTKFTEMHKKIMELLVAKYMNNIKEVDEEIKQLYAQNQLLCSHPLYIVKDKELSEHLEQVNSDLIKNKEQTFARDKIAFANH